MTSSRADLKLAARGAIAVLITLCGVAGIAWCFDGYALLRGLGYSCQAWTMAIFGLNTLLALLLSVTASLISRVRCLLR